MTLPTCLLLIPRRAFVLVGVCSALFFLLAADVKFHGLITKIDQKTSHWIHAHGLEKQLFLRLATELGDGGVAERFAWAVAVVLVLVRRWHYLPALFFSVLIGLRLNSRMQNFFARPRPHFDDVMPLTHPGFPSGHAAAAVLIYGFLIILAAREVRDQSLKLGAIVLATLCILLVGWTRIGLLAHYPSDVVGSILWGTTWLAGCYYANQAAYQWSAPNLTAWAPKRLDAALT